VYISFLDTVHYFAGVYECAIYATDCCVYYASDVDSCVVSRHLRRRMHCYYLYFSHQCEREDWQDRLHEGSRVAGSGEATACVVG